MKKAIFGIVMLFSNLFVNAQFINLFSVDTTKYPTISAKFHAMNSAGVLDYSLTPADFKMEENGSQAKVIDVINPQERKVLQASFVVTLDVSGSTTGESIFLEKIAAQALIKQIPLDACEAAVTTFNDQSFTVCDFSKNQNTLLARLEGVFSGGGTDYNSGIMDPNTSSVSMAKNARYKSIIVFISDGYGDGTTQSIIERVNSTNSRFYSITTYPTPQSIKEVVTKQNSLYFENIRTEKAALEAIAKILIHALDAEPSTVIWQALPSCTRNINVSAEAKQMGGKTKYNISGYRTLGLSILPEIVQFGEVNPRDSMEISITITTKDQDVRIDSIKSLNPEWFKVSGRIKFPVWAKKGEKLEIPIVFTPLDSGMIIDQMYFYNSLCNNTYNYTKGGFAGVKSWHRKKTSLVLLKPNGNEKLSVGTNTKIIWQGIDAEKEVTITYSDDNGANWKPVGVGKQFSFDWTVPCYQSSNYLVKIQGYESSDKVMPLLYNQTIQGYNRKQSVLVLTNKAINSNTVSLLYNLPFGCDTAIYNQNETKIILVDSKLRATQNAIINARTGKKLFSINTKFAKNLYFTKAGNCVVGSTSKTTGIIDSLNTIIYEGPKGTVNYDGSLILSKDKKRKNLFSTHSKEKLFSVNSKTEIKFSPYNTMYSVLNKKKKLLTIYDSVTKQIRIKENVQQVHFLPNGKDMLCVMKNKIITPKGKTKLITQAQVFDIATDSLLQTLEGQFYRSTPFEFSKDSSRYICFNNDLLQIIDFKTGKLIYKVETNNFNINRNATFVAIQKKDYTEVFDTDSNRLAYKFIGQKGTFSNRNNMFFTTVCSYHTYMDKEIKMYVADVDSCKLWDMKTGKNVYTIFDRYPRRETTRPPKAVMQAIFSEDGNQIITENKNIWHFPDPDPLMEDVSDNTFQVSTSKAKLTEVEFNKTALGDWQDMIVKGFITNPSANQISITGIAIKGEAADEFILKSTPPPFILQSGASIDVEFAFHPKKEGKRKAMLEVSSCSDVQFTPISGTGFKIDLEIVKLINFGKKRLGTKTDTTVMVIKNIGTTPVTLINSAILGPDVSQFKIITNLKNRLIKAGESINVELQFAPDQRGQTSTMFALAFKEFEKPRIVKLLGTGDAPRFVVVNGTVFNVVSNKPTSGTISVIDLLSKREIKNFSAPENGRFSFELDMDRNYGIVASKANFISAGANVDLSQQIFESKIERNIYITPMEVGGTIVLNNIFFASGSSQLKPESHQELEKMQELLTKFPAMEIEISGHTDSEGTKEDNSVLSQQRAEAVANYLIKKGINSTRIKAKGYADTKPVNSNETADGRQKNRRVEMTIKKK